MHFNHVLDEQLQNQYQFRGVECSAQVQDRFQEYAFLGYCLKDCFSFRRGICAGRTAYSRRRDCWSSV